MDTPVLLACPLCAFSSPIFLVLSFFVGSVGIGYWFLRPSVARLKRVWGFPKITCVRLLALLLMLLGPTAMFFVGRYNYDVVRTSFCVAGLAACVVYLWFRACWLLQELRVESISRQLLFLAILLPGILVVGTVAGNWLLGMVFVVPAWPVIIVPHTITCAAVGIPLGLVVYYAVQYVLDQHKPLPQLAANDVAENIGGVDTSPHRINVDTSQRLATAPLELSPKDDHCEAEECPWCEERVIQTKDDRCPRCDRPI